MKDRIMAQLIETQQMIKQANSKTSQFHKGHITCLPQYNPQKQFDQKKIIKTQPNYSFSQHINYNKRQINPLYQRLSQLKLTKQNSHLRAQIQSLKYNQSRLLDQIYALKSQINSIQRPIQNKACTCQQSSHTKIYRAISDIRNDMDQLRLRLRFCRRYQLL